MKRPEKIYDNHFDDLMIQGYGEECARFYIWYIFQVVLNLVEKGKITKQEEKGLLNKIFPGWSEEEICKFKNSEENSPDRIAGYKRMEMDCNHIWRRYVEEGKENYLKRCVKRDKCTELQNKMVDYAEKENLLKNSIIKEQYHYGVVIVMAQKLQRFGGDYLKAVQWQLSEGHGRSLLDKQELLQIVQILEDAEFGGYKVSEEDGYIRELMDTTVELIYKMYIKDKPKPDEIKKMIQETNNIMDLFEFQCSVRASLQEHIDRMEAIFDRDIYPVDVILQMLGYPALSREEYDQRVAVMKKEIEEI